MELSRLQAVIGAALARAPRVPRVAWIDAESAHVTLRFIGEVTEQRAAALQAALTAGLPVRAFEITWGAIGLFPPRAAPRVIWMGATSGTEELVTLARLLNERVDSMVSAGETRALTPHVTIGRIKEPGRGLDWRRTLQAVTVRPVRATIDHVTLYQSRTSAKGATYTALSVCPLLYGET